MTHTQANVAVGGRPYITVGPFKETITDVTWSGATATETVTAAELGLNGIQSASAQIQAAVASATGVEASTAITTGGASVVISLNTVAAAGTGQAGSIVRVTARGF